MFNRPLSLDFISPYTIVKIKFHFCHHSERFDLEWQYLITFMPEGCGLQIFPNRQHVGHVGCVVFPYQILVASNSGWPCSVDLNTSTRKCRGQKSTTHHMWHAIGELGSPLYCMISFLCRANAWWVIREKLEK